MAFLLEFLSANTRRAMALLIPLKKVGFRIGGDDQPFPPHNLLLGTASLHRWLFVGGAVSPHVPQGPAAPTTGTQTSWVLAELRGAGAKVACRDANLHLWLMAMQAWSDSGKCWPPFGLPVCWFADFTSPLQGTATSTGTSS